MAALQKELEQLHTANGNLEEQCKAAAAGQLDAQVLEVLWDILLYLWFSFLRSTSSRAEVLPLHLPAPLASLLLVQP